jgi:beta-carotene 3-hydroxylase
MVNILLLLVAFFLMEFVAWWSHKYIMHGFLLKWHIDHHRKDHRQALPKKTEDKQFEKNDRFFIVFALPAIILLMMGLFIPSVPLVFIGIGITLYGLCYFIIHDIIIHQRINILSGIKNNFYIQAVIKAHEAHHKPKNKNDFNNFGLLVFPRRFFKK